MVRHCRRTLPLGVSLSARRLTRSADPPTRPVAGRSASVAAPVPGVRLRAARPGSLLHRARAGLRRAGRAVPRPGRATLLDVGGGPGYFRDAFTAAGATYFSLDSDVGELAGAGDIGAGTVIGSGMDLPFRDGAVDVCYSSNVLEHVPDPWRMAERDGARHPARRLVFISYTTWFGPWGGHETSPWHFLGGRRARRRYTTEHGHEPKNKFGESLFAVTVADGPAVGAPQQDVADVVHLLPRYNPWWSRWLLRVPVVREVVTWNLVLVLRKRVITDEHTVPLAATGCLRAAHRPRDDAVARPPGPRHQARPRGRAAGLPRTRRPPVGRRGRLRPAAEPGLRLPVADGSVLRARRPARRARAGWSSDCGWRCVLCVAFIGAAKVTRALGVRSDLACLLAGARVRALAAHAHRVGASSIEVWPMALAPWVLLPLVIGSERGSATPGGRAVGAGDRDGGRRQRRRDLRGAAARCAVAADPAAGPAPARADGVVAGVHPAGDPVVAGAAVPARRLQPALPRLHRDRPAVTTVPTEPLDALRGTSDWVPYVDGSSVPATTCCVDFYLPVNSVIVLAAACWASRCAHTRPTVPASGLVCGLFLVTMGHLGAVQGWFAPISAGAARRRARAAAQRAQVRRGPPAASGGGAGLVGRRLVVDGAGSAGTAG